MENLARCILSVFPTLLRGQKCLFRKKIENKENFEMKPQTKQHVFYEQHLAKSNHLPLFHFRLGVFIPLGISKNEIWNVGTKLFSKNTNIQLKRKFGTQ